MALAWWVNRRIARYGDRNWHLVSALAAQLSADQMAAALHGDFTAAWWLRIVAASPRLVAAAVTSLALESSRRLPTP
jgi:hypothetical protein